MIDRYQLLQKIGEGAFGEVWMAEQRLPVRRRLAIKILKLGMDSRHVIARFEAERQALALMDHQNIARVIDGGITPTGRPYFAMELVRGQPITAFCDQQKLTFPERIRLFIKVCQAVQHAHQKGIIHRDIKPSNILVYLHDSEAVPKVIDFGIAKATQFDLTDNTLFTHVHHFLGTPSYVSPEQVELNGLDVDTRSDIYSLGALFYELLTSRTPFETLKLFEGGFDGMRRTIREVEPTRPSVRVAELGEDDRRGIASCRRVDSIRLIRLLKGDIDWIVMKCLEKDRRRRYETANALAADLKRHLDFEPIVARPPSAGYRLQKAWKRNRLVFSASIAAATALFVGFVGIFWQLRAAEAARESAMAARDDAEKARAEASREAKNARLESARATRAWSLANFQITRPSQDTVDQRTELAYLAELIRLQPTNREYSELAVSILSSQNWPLARTLSHGAAVKFARWTPTGDEVVTASVDGMIRLWNGRSAALLSSFSAPGPITRAALSHGGTILATVTDADIHLWNVRSGRRIGGPFRHRAEISAIEFRQEDQHLLAASMDGAITLWPTTGESSPVMARQLNRPVLSATFRRSGATLAIGDINGSVEIYNSETGELIPLNEMVHPNNGQLMALAFDPLSDRLASGAVGNNFRARIWDSSTGEPVTPEFSQGGILDMEFSPDGKLLAVGVEFHYQAEVWQVTPFRLVATIKHTSAVRQVRFSPNGQLLLSVSDDHSARLSHPYTGELAQEPMLHEDRIIDAHFSPDGRSVVTASQDRSARVWDVLKGSETAIVLTHDASISTALFNRLGDRALTASADRTAAVWAVDGTLLRRLSGHEARLTLARFSPDGRQILTASEDGTIRVMDSENGQLMYPPLAHAATNRLEIWDAQFSPDGKSIASVSYDGTSRLWDAATGNEITPKRIADVYAWRLSFSSDSRSILVPRWANEALLWNTSTTLDRPIAFKHDGIVEQAVFSPDGLRILTGARDNKAYVWRAADGVKLSGPMSHRGVVSACAFSPDAHLVATGSRDGKARIWESVTGRAVGDPIVHRSHVVQVQFSPDGQHLATASIDGEARISSPSSGRPLARPITHNPPYAAITSLQFSPDGAALLTGSEDGTGRISPLPPVVPQAPDWLAALCEIVAGARLDPEGALLRTNLWAELPRIRETLEMSQGEDSITRWGRWFFANRADRGISWQSKLTGDEFVVTRIRDGSERAFAEAERFSPTHPLVLASRYSRASDKVESDHLWQGAMRQRPNDPAVLSLLLGGQIPARDNGALRGSLDLTPFYNAAFGEEWHNRFDIGNNFAPPAPGRQIIDGVEYDIRGIVQLAGSRLDFKRPGFPREISGIPVDLRTASIHFLFSTAWSVKDDLVIAQLRFHFEDGRTDEHPIRFGHHVRNWQFSRETQNEPGPSPVWRGKQTRGQDDPDWGVRLYHLVWNNPRPDVRVVSLDLRSTVTESAPFFVAITAE